MPLFYSPGWVSQGPTVKLETLTNQVQIGPDGTFVDSAARLLVNRTGGGNASTIAIRNDSDAIEVSVGVAGTFGFLRTRTNHSLFLGANNANAWEITTGLHFRPDADNSRDIGTATTFQVRSIFVGTSVVWGTHSLQVVAGPTALRLKAGGDTAFLVENDTAAAQSALGANASGTYVGSINNVSVSFRQNNTVRWLINTSGHLVPNADNTYDIGISGTNDVRTIYLQTSIVLGSVTLTDAGSGFLQSAGGYIVNNASLGYRTVGGEFQLASSGTGLFIDTGGSITDINLRPGGSTVKLKVTTTGIGFFNTTPAAQQTSGANLTNNVTSGGTDDTVDNIVAAAVDTTAASLVSTRNACYQLARKLKQINDGLRTYGLFT